MWWWVLVLVASVLAVAFIVDVFIYIATETEAMRQENNESDYSSVEEDRGF